MKIHEFLAVAVSVMVYSVGLIAGPVSPEEEKASFVLADPDIRMDLVASEPDVVSPVAMAWGPDGELFVAEMPGYPLRENSGRIKLLSDSDRDGRYHLRSVFADGLQFPNSVMPYRDGVLVCDAPEILFLKDRDGDGVADIKEVVWTGFTPGNHQLRVNGLFWGLDNWIYGANGRSGGSIKSPGSDKVISVNFHDFRFDPNHHSIEPISGYSQYGLAQDNGGNRFITLNHRFARQVVLEKRYIDKNPELSPFAVHDTYMTEHDRRVHTLVPDTRRFNTDPVGYFTSLSGLTAYRGHLLGEKYQGSFFAGESVQSCVIHRRMRRDGVIYEAENLYPGHEFIATTDGWFHPVNFSNGPDGAFYLVDFYRKYVEHPRWAYDNLSEGVDWNEGEPHGRIWRIYHKDHPGDRHAMFPQFSKASTPALVEALKSPSGWRRDTAHRLLVEQMDKVAAGEAAQSILSGRNPLASIHMLRVLDGMGILSPQDIEAAMRAPDAHLASHAIKLAGSRAHDHPALQSSLISLVDSEDPMIRFQAILALGDSDADELLDALLPVVVKYRDKWTRVAIMSCVSGWCEKFIDGLIHHLEFARSCHPQDLEFINSLGKIASRTSNQSALEQRIANLTSGNMLTDIELALTAGCLSRLPAGHSINVEMGPDLVEYLWSQIHTASPENGRRIDYIFNVLAFSSPTSLTQQRITSLVQSEVPDIQELGVELVGRFNDPDKTHFLFSSMASMSSSMRGHVIKKSLVSPSMTRSLLGAMKQGDISPIEIPEDIRRGLLHYPDKEISESAEQLLSSTINADKQEVIDHYLGEIKSLPVNLESGASVFSRHCIQCHAIQGRGSQFAPDLTSLGSRSNSFLLTSILDPGRMVSYELKLQIISTKDGRVFSGIVASESTDSKTLKQPDGTTHLILRKNIKSQTGTDQSIMPDGFHHLISPSQMASLLGFIRQPDADLLNSAEVQAEFE